MGRLCSCSIFVLSLLFSGCSLSWHAPWGEVRPPSTVDAQPLLAQATASFATAGDAAAVDAALTAYERVLTADPGNYRALVDASTLSILRGTAYTTNASHKSEYFFRAMRYAELAMYTNPAFRIRADAGATPWEAADTLDAAEAEAMFFWVTALQYEFKEGMSLPSKIINIVWLQRSLIFLDRIEAVAPDFGGGAVDFAKVICYLALPESRGGSKAKGEACMQQAVAKADGWLLPRWGRGKYYFPIRGEDEKGRQDLAWVAAQPLDQYKDPYPWRVHFRDNAREILAD